MENLLHASVEPGDAAEVEGLGGLVDDGAVGNGIRGNWKRKGRGFKERLWNFCLLNVATLQTSHVCFYISEVSLPNEGSPPFPPPSILRDLPIASNIPPAL